MRIRWNFGAYVRTNIFGPKCTRIRVLIPCVYACPTLVTIVFFFFFKKKKLKKLLAFFCFNFFLFIEFLIFNFFLFILLFLVNRRHCFPLITAHPGTYLRPPC